MVEAGRPGPRRLHAAGKERGFVVVCVVWGLFSCDGDEEALAGVQQLRPRRASIDHFSRDPKAICLMRNSLAPQPRDPTLPATSGLAHDGEERPPQLSSRRPIEPPQRLSCRLRCR